MKEKPTPTESESVETLSSRPGHYHSSKYSVIELQGYVMNNYGKGLLRGNPYLGENDGGQGVDQRIWCIGSMVKHMMRLGLKDDVDIELKKIENYAHYARTGEWMDE